MCWCVRRIEWSRRVQNDQRYHSTVFKRQYLIIVCLRRSPYHLALQAQGMRVFRQGCGLISPTADLTASLIAGKSEKNLHKSPKTPWGCLLEMSHQSLCDHWMDRLTNLAVRSAPSAHWTPPQSLCGDTVEIVLPVAVELMFYATWSELRLPAQLCFLSRTFPSTESAVTTRTDRLIAQVMATSSL